MRIESNQCRRSQEAIAEVFLLAFRALPKADRDAVVVRIASDKRLVKAILSLAKMKKRGTKLSRQLNRAL